MISTSSRPILLGHRGARLRAPENTLRAFEFALSDGCDGFEFDVRQTRDGKLVCCHDATVFRKSIARNRYEKLQEAISANNHRNERGMPLLEEVLARFGDRAYLDIEIKVAGIGAAVAHVLRRLPTQRCIVSSFLPAALREVRRAAPLMRLGYICRSATKLKRWKKLPCEVVIPHFSLISEALVAEVHDAGKQVFAWTVNPRQEMLRLAKIGVDGIISDETETLGRTFGAGR